MSSPTNANDEKKSGNDIVLSWEQLINLPMDSLTDLDADEQMSEQLGLAKPSAQDPVDYELAQRLMDLPSLARADSGYKISPDADGWAYRDDHSADVGAAQASAATSSVPRSATNTFSAHVELTGPDEAPGTSVADTSVRHDKAHKANSSDYTTDTAPDIDDASEFAHSIAFVPLRYAHLSREQQIERARADVIERAFDESKASNETCRDRPPTYSASPLGDRKPAYQTPRRSPPLSPSTSSLDLTQHTPKSTPGGATAPSLAGKHLKTQRDLFRIDTVQQLRQRLDQCNKAWSMEAHALHVALDDAHRQAAFWQDEARGLDEQLKYERAVVAEQAGRGQDETRSLEEQLAHERAQVAALQRESAMLRDDVDRMRPIVRAQEEREAELERERQDPEWTGSFVPLEEWNKPKEHIELMKRLRATDKYRQTYELVRGRVEWEQRRREAEYQRQAAERKRARDGREEEKGEQANDLSEMGDEQDKDTEEPV